MKSAQQRKHLAKVEYGSVDDYLATMPELTRGVLEKVRALVREELPDAEETISYRIPAHKRAGGTVVFFAGRTKHVSLYPVGPRFAEMHPELAAGYELSAGTIRIPLTAQFPEILVRAVVRFRSIEADAEARTRKPRRSTTVS